MKRFYVTFIKVLAYTAAVVIISTTCGIAAHSTDSDSEFISPRNGGSVHGPLVIEARLQNPSVVDHLEFYVQEHGARDRFGWRQYEPPYRWGGKDGSFDTTLLNDGPASAVVFVVMKDKAKGKVERRIMFEIQNGKPFIHIVSPKQEALADNVMTVMVEAHDDVGIYRAPGIASVSILVDGKPIDKLSAPPYQFEIATCLLSQGLHILRTVAVDSDGLSNADELLFLVK